jgi:2-isopropylmalate synthase
LRGHELHTKEGRTTITAQLEVEGTPVTVTGEGEGPIEAFVHGLCETLHTVFDVVDYAEHAMGRGADATAVAYVESSRADGEIRWGIGTDPNITTASLRAVVSAFERQQR